MASIVCLYMISSCRCMLSNSQTKNGLASTSNSNELDAVLFLVLPWNVSCPKVLNFLLVIHKQRSLTFSSGHPVCSLHIKFSLFYQPCYVHSWATTLLERVWQRLRVGVACFGCGNELFFIYNHGHIFLTFRFTAKSKKQKVRLTQILREFPHAGQLFLAKEYRLAENLETALSPYDIFDRVAGGLICCCCCCCFFFFPTEVFFSSLFT